MLERLRALRMSVLPFIRDDEDVGIVERTLEELARRAASDDAAFVIAPASNRNRDRPKSEGGGGPYYQS
jgi:hypothetical protein